MDKVKYQRWIDDNILSAMNDYASYLYENSATNIITFLSDKELARILAKTYFHIKFYNDQELIDFMKYFTDYIKNQSTRIRTIITCLSLLKCNKYWEEK